MAASAPELLPYAKIREDLFRPLSSASARYWITICAAHHLHGLHAGVLRAWGRAPSAVHWQLGVRVAAPPLLSSVGDRYCEALEESPATALG